MVQLLQKWASPNLSIWVTDVLSTGFNVITTAREPILNTQCPLVPLLTQSLLTKNITESKTWHETYYCISLKKLCSINHKTITFVKLKPHTCKISTEKKWVLLVSCVLESAHLFPKSASKDVMQDMFWLGKECVLQRPKLEHNLEVVVLPVQVTCMGRIGNSVTVVCSIWCKIASPLSPIWGRWLMYKPLNE